MSFRSELVKQSRSCLISEVMLGPTKSKKLHRTMHLRTILVAVPALSLVLPVTTSGPVTHSISTSQSPRIWLGSTHASPIVPEPTSCAYLSPPRTYGVLPEDAIPMRTSLLDKGGDKLDKFWTAESSESSDPSTADRSATSPPAINPTNCHLGAENVGGLLVEPRKN